MKAALRSCEGFMSAIAGAVASCTKALESGSTGTEQIEQLLAQCEALAALMS